MGQYKSIYNNKKWFTLRRDQLQKQPLCQYCQDHGLVTPATVVDHIKPHRGNFDLAYDPGNLQSLCKQCHDIHADAKDRDKVISGCDSNGYPIDPNHPWNK